ncbi:MAG: RpiB/LacA/LacB family sugar-phosphate isomerase [Elusimicrobia bacterium]|nr:RpiB/LacA/LacB family sugar-phosphate isomerase [Elusimicrobiota bacterium]
MRLAIAADHAGYELKRWLQRALERDGHEVLNLGVDGPEPVDYPDFARKAADAVRAGRAERGIVVCGSGVGACVAANKMPGIRAGLCHDTFSARQGVEDDDVNVLCLGGRVIGPELAGEVARAFLKARFSNAERHVRRRDKVTALEKEFREAKP